MQMREAIPIVRARLQAGEVVDHRDLNALACRPPHYASHVLRDWHKAGLTHIACYERGRSSHPIPRYRWGPGVDAKKPAPFTSAETVRRSRARNPEWKFRDAALRKARRLQARPPALDPVMAALLGTAR